MGLESDLAPTTETLVGWLSEFCTRSRWRRAVLVVSGPSAALPPALPACAFPLGLADGISEIPLRTFDQTLPRRAARGEIATFSARLWELAAPPENGMACAGLDLREAGGTLGSS